MADALGDVRGAVRSGRRDRAGAGGLGYGHESGGRAEQMTRREEGKASVDAREVERWKVEEAARFEAVPGRIESGELVVAKYVQVVRGVWGAVDEKTEARHFWEMGVGCYEHGGRLYVEKKQALESGEWLLLERAGGNMRGFNKSRCAEVGRG